MLRRSFETQQKQRRKRRWPKSRYVTVLFTLSCLTPNMNQQEKPVPQKRPGILRKPTVQFVTPFPLPLTRRGAELAEGSAANSGRSMRRLQASDIPSEPDSESDPESDSSSEAESDVGDVVEIHPLEAWERYDSKWKTIDKSGLEEALVSNRLCSCFCSMTNDTFTIACSMASAVAGDFRQTLACQQRRGREVLQ